MWPLLLAGLGTYTGLKNAQFQRDQEKRNMMANAAAIQYSPWTGMNPGMMKANQTNPTLQALQGGLAGGMQGLAIKKYMSQNPAQEQEQPEEKKKKEEQAPIPTYGENAFGSAGYMQKLADYLR